MPKGLQILHITPQKASNKVRVDGLGARAKDSRVQASGDEVQSPSESSTGRGVAGEILGEQ